MPQNDSTINFAVAFRGMEPDNSVGTDNYITRVSEETTLLLPFGFAVMQGTADSGCKSFTSQTGKILGIIPYAAIYAVDAELQNRIADANGNFGLKGGVDISIKRRGRLWVAIDEDVIPTSAVRIRTTVVASQGPGVFRKTANAGDTVDVSKCANWQGTFAAANGFGLLEYDFTAVRSLMVAD